MVGQIGCVTAFVALVIIAIAFGIGWFLDDLMGNERKIMTIILLLASFPVTLFAMVRISLAMVGRTQQQVEKTNQDNNKEETTP
jgi:F0F1-type ATP synthase assembly protein I